MTQPSVIKQAVLTVKDLDRTVEFYEKVLGFKVIERTNEKASISTDGETALLVLEQRKDATPRDPRTTGLYHIAFLLPHRSHLADIVNYFIQTRYPLQGASDHHVSEALYLADPEGNGIEIYIDRDPDNWIWQKDQVYMTTVALDIENLLQEATETGWKGMPEKTIIGHIHLQVAELEETREYYCDGLGFDLVLRYGGQALFISKNKYHHHIGLNTWNSKGAPAPEENTTGLKYFTIALLNDEAKQNVIKQLEKISASFSEKDGRIITKDPSGIEIVLEVEER
ncbi:VOC family protein [Bacillus sp. FJAT-49732]|uniref:VOC family protein n=1 Tax=Lederbergia citrisecunda TaxID=2833583 RepID=A0A942YLX8_9BACI|nr:VOC family protein [Lederbergia citrisecunda]MBS4200869.1 VOC family protein [Lederbergia citrisecunda]